VLEFNAWVGANYSEVFVFSKRSYYMYAFSRLSCQYLKISVENTGNINISGGGVCCASR